MRSNKSTSLETGKQARLELKHHLTERIRELLHAEAFGVDGNDFLYGSEVHQVSPLILHVRIPKPVGPAILLQIQISEPV